MSSSILVTGGAGYIGSHTVLELLRNHYQVIVADNLSNASRESLVRVERLTGKSIEFYQADICEPNALAEIFTQHSISGVIHFAGLKAVGESVKHPLSYYMNNVYGTLVLLQIMKQFNVSQLVFSSSATVYGDNNPPPYVETQPPGLPTSPYGKTKAMIEQVLKDECKSNANFKVASLRYFNPIGADESGFIGEDPDGIPNNLMPFITQVAAGKQQSLAIFGNDYPTQDGTCKRDYLHVTDLAIGHIKALKYLELKPDGGCDFINLGTGNSVSVLDIVAAFESVTGQSLPYHFASRREGDLDAFWANADKAKRLLNWQSERTLTDMMEDTWRWLRKNPNGYKTKNMVT